MTEDFLHHTWKFRLFDNAQLTTTAGMRLKVLKPGEHNTHAGPDFFNARIALEDTQWAGNVEVHICASDWQKHQHTNDKSYDNIILHVVYNADQKLFRANGEEIPTLELKPLMKSQQFDKYLSLKESTAAIACTDQSKSVDTFVVNNLLDRLAAERLESKADAILQTLSLNRNNWEETFYLHLAKNFGFKVNAVPFELLAKSVPPATLAKHRDSLLQLEALLFGQAGWLEKPLKDTYPRQLQNEYKFLKQKFNLKPLEEHLWKFLRLRPANFPTVRVAQFAGLMHRSNNLFSMIIEAGPPKEIYKLLDVSCSDYWQNHFIFDKTSPVRKKNLGKSAVDNLLINTVAPFLFVYGKKNDEPIFMEKALALLVLTGAEENSVIGHWGSIGLKAANALQSQALLQLKNEYCRKKRCLDCSIGNFLIKNC
jgi:hypothetical protein